MQITAAVVRERAGPFVLEPIELDDPRPGEVLVQVAASGMCHTDLHGRDGYYGTPFPAVFGHEGAGRVLAVGSGVKSVAPGDQVIMSFPWCGTCPNCQAHVPAHCMHQWELKMRGTRADGSTLMRKDDAPVYSAFFQQSSFGTRAISQERFVVKVRSDAPLDHLGPLACGVQTGAGAVLNVIQPKAGDSIAVFGVGGVGLSALMAAKLAGCDPIIAVDIHASRLALARELGATHTIESKAGTDLPAEIRKLTGYGVRHAVETTAIPAIFRQAVEALMPLGTCILLGSARPGTDVSLEMPKLQDGRGVRGVIQGWSEPQVFLPRLVDLMMEGKLPVERLLTFYDFADINRAAADAASGKTIKPVLRMPQRD
ncbi:MAG TPA: NAD(P)-dependent alcohol dehydrogenase [Xanthobacteraceae bacterium]